MLTCCQDDDITMDPFFDIEQHVLLGVANIFTQCLYHRICHKYDAPIIGPTGKVTITYCYLVILMWAGMWQYEVVTGEDSRYAVMV